MAKRGKDHLRGPCEELKRQHNYDDIQMDFWRTRQVTKPWPLTPADTVTISHCSGHKQDGDAVTAAIDLHSGMILPAEPIESEHLSLAEPSVAKLLSGKSEVLEHTARQQVQDPTEQVVWEIILSLKLKPSIGTSEDHLTRVESVW